MASFLGNASNNGKLCVGTESSHDRSSSFVTLLTDDTFFPGVTALCASLKASNSGDKFMRKPVRRFDNH